MRPRFRRIAVLAGVAGLASPAAAVPPGAARQRRLLDAVRAGPARRRARPEPLSPKLGVSTSKLQQAMESTRPAQGESPTDVAGAVAEELGLSAGRVRSAMRSTMPQGGPPQGGTPPQGAPRRTPSRADSQPILSFGRGLLPASAPTVLPTRPSAIPERPCASRAFSARP